jgi:putative ubiquitin-RnfH superfamily antitoxin RatB of RatAB toxin-antitoxin module
MREAGEMVRATVIYSPAPREVHEWAVDLPAGATLLQALKASGLAAAYPDADLVGALVGVWGRKARPGQLLRDGDRLEIYRPLKVDPKVARRERFRKQGVRAAGLFTRKKGGPKPAV